MLLLGLVVAAGAGLAIGEWRRANPELAAALERIDRADDDDRPFAPPPRSTLARPTPPAAPIAVARPVAPRVPDGPLDVNRATIDDLTRLPGIGPVLAARIVAARDANGAFASIDDLRRVSGVGPSKLAALRQRLVVPP